MTAAPTERRLREGERAPADPYAPVGRGLPRWSDIVIALLVLIPAAPFLLLIMLAIRLDTPGPAIYRQTRVGIRGETFDLYKLRTMGIGNDPVGVGTLVTHNDPRVTRVGRPLRRFSIDEIPNLINVLRGEMRIVGPRPTIPSQVELFDDHQHRRHAVRPGMTGWAQINGHIGIEWAERIELDVWYVENRSLGLDLKILARTAWQVISGRGLYTGG